MAEQSPVNKQRFCPVCGELITPNPTEIKEHIKNPRIKKYCSMKCWYKQMNSYRKEGQLCRLKESGQMKP